MTNKMTTQVEKITPAIAEKMLASCSHNRPIDTQLVNLYTQEMLADRWKTTSQGIAIDWNGCMHQGQHRLLAVVKSGVTIYMNVTRNEDPENFKVLDVLKTRTSGQVFQLAGIANACRMAAIVKADTIMLQTGYNNHQSDKTAGVTPLSLLEEYNRNSEFYQNIQTKAANWYTKSGKLLPITTIAAMYIQMCIADEEKGNEFFDKLSTGLGLSGVQDPIYILRQKLVSNATSTKKYSAKFINAFVIKGWNLFISKKFCKQIVFSDKEVFPELKLSKSK